MVPSRTVVDRFVVPSMPCAGALLFETTLVIIIKAGGVNRKVGRLLAMYHAMWS